MAVLRCDWDPAAHAGAEALELRVDGVLLTEWIRAHEEPIAEAAGEPRVAGGYAGLVAWALPPDVSAHLLGGPDSHLTCGPHDKTVLLGCTCGEPGCWPLMARVRATPTSVTWNEFEQPHRRGRWSYSRVPALVFDRPAYDEAIAGLGPRPSAT